MSLGGLDSAAIKQAHEAANAEPGGWFLLKYASRDEVELYGRGTTGVVEMRKAIAQFEEESPLYGFLKYRRRNVIIKYQPEGCSRLVQARATVHFNAICDNFQPFNTTFELTNAKDLKDTKLSAACSLHTATGSTCSSTSSLRRRRLMEITEEEEEEERERKRQSIVHDEEEIEDGSEATPHSPPLSSPEPPVVLDRQQITDPQDPDFASIPDPATFSGAAAQPASPSKSEFDTEPPRRQSSQLTRPELYTYSSYPYGKPKVKLAPRPSMDANLRPHTAGTYRPIAALPAGFKLSRSAKKNKAEHKEEEEMSQKEDGKPTSNATSTTAQDHLEYPDATNTTTLLLPARPATSSGASLKGSLALADKNKMTPEKARLMKAMKLREKKKKMSMLPSEMVVPEPEPSETENTVLNVQPEEHIEEAEKDNGQKDVEPATADPELPALTMHNTEDASTASHPPSPTVGSSEVGVSTKASSLSESTDETIQHAAKDTEPEVKDSLPGSEPEPKVSDEVVVHNMENEPSEAEPLASTTTPSNNETTDSTVMHQDATDGKPDVSETLDVPLDEESPKIPEKEHDQQVEDVTVAASSDEAIAPTPTDEAQIEVQIPQSRSREVAPLNQDEPSPKSPYGVPLSRFSSNEAKSPPTPTLKSRFSTQDLRKASFAEPIPVVAEVIPSSSDAPSEKVQPIAESTDAGPEEASSQLSTKVKHKPAAIDLTRTEPVKDTPHSEVNDPVLDDALLDELQAATLQHAQPMTVAKSPITPVFPSTSPRKSQVPAVPRSVSNPLSNPLRNSLQVPVGSKFGSLRRVSTNGSNMPNGLSRQASNASMQSSKVGNVGSSISQRIKALEQLSAKEKASKGNEAPARNRPTTPSSNFLRCGRQRVSENRRYLLRRPTLLRLFQCKNLHPMTLPTTRLIRVVSLGVTDQALFRAGCRFSSPITLPQPLLHMRHADGQKLFRSLPESNLKQSPLVVDHQKAEPAEEPISDPAATSLAAAPSIVEQPKETILERRNSKQESDGGADHKRRSSLNIVKGFIKDRRASVSSRSNSVDNLAAPSPAASSRSPTRPPSAQHSSSGSIVRRLSISSRRSLSRDREMASPISITEESEEKGGKQSAASRLMRRLSSSFGSSRKAQSPSISPTVAEEEDDASTAVTSRPDSQVSSSNHSMNQQSLVSTYMGDVNVQFPDNLLWKRRTMCLDSAGYLVLSALQGHAPAAKDRVVGTKRYHMSDFRLPYIPDVEVQELPNSVVLDFVDGSGLQIACEDRAGQMSTLHTLEDAHQKYTS
ncbi:hypothetical protein PG999_003596 [Apiospora kogelbergensis]|uniref:ADF-H domain-containing protein n=1 Tax=Apiospora kogelbergensis TaxID=1337665 RepID=A0AAW0R3Y0_9PEZI